MSTLSHSLSDYPRLLRVLRTRRGYELLSEHEIHLAQLEVRREVEPQIRELNSRAESGLEALQRKERALHEKVRPAHITPGSDRDRGHRACSRCRVTLLHPHAQLIQHETRKRNTALRQQTEATAAASASARPPSRQSARVASSPEVAKLRARLMALQTQRGRPEAVSSMCSKYLTALCNRAETLLKAAERADEELRGRKAGLGSRGAQA